MTKAGLVGRKEWKREECVLEQSEVCGTESVDTGLEILVLCTESE